MQEKLKDSEVAGTFWIDISPLKWRSFTSMAFFWMKWNEVWPSSDEFGGTPKASFVGGISWPFQVFFTWANHGLDRAIVGSAAVDFSFENMGCDVWSVIFPVQNASSPSDRTWQNRILSRYCGMICLGWSKKGLLTPLDPTLVCLTNLGSSKHPPGFFVKATCNKGRQFKIMIYLWCSWISLSNKFIMLMKRKD